MQGALALMWELEQALIAVTGMARVTLQPAAGAHGELTGMLMIRKALEDARRASQGRADPGLRARHQPGLGGVRRVRGGRDRLHRARARSTSQRSPGTSRAATSPRSWSRSPTRSACSSPRSSKAAAMLHERGAFLYMDGANLNAFVGIALPGQDGRRRAAHQPAQDVLDAARRRRSGRRPGRGVGGAGAVPAGAHGREGRRPLHARLRPPRAASARCAAFYGNFGMLVRALAYIRSLGRDGLQS